MIKRNNKKGFTIVELVIVIAVIAILAAVLIPTFSGIIKKANISSDTQLCKNMNTALSMAKAEGKALDTMEDVLFAINEAGYVIENLNPTTEGYYFAWDEKNGQILFLTDALELHYPTDATLVPSDCWITVLEADEITKVAGAGFGLYLEPGFTGGLTLDKLVSVDAGANAGVNLTINNNDAGNIVIRGSYDTVELNATGAHVEQYGVIGTATGKVAANSFVVNGFVKSLALTEGKVVVAATGVVETVEDSAKSLVNATESKGIIITGAPAGYAAATDINVTINNKAELEAFRDIVNGGYTYEGVTVTLNADIDLAGVAWTPIGNFYRKDTAGNLNITNGFMGTFDGDGHTIKNLSNEGFSVSGLKFGTTSTTPANCNEAVYGLFGSIINATIKNLNVTANINMIYVGDNLGDSIGIIAGFASATDGKVVKIENCTVSGSVAGYDNVAGILGNFRIISKTTGNLVVNGCTNNATVTAQRKAAGIVGMSSGAVAMNKNANKGNVTSIGASGDVEPLSTPGNYYVAASHITVTSATKVALTMTDCTNSGTVTCTSAQNIIDGNIN